MKSISQILLLELLVAASGFGIYQTIISRQNTSFKMVGIFLFCILISNCLAKLFLIIIRGGHEKA